MLASSELVDEIYRAALSPSEWEPFLAQMARTFHAAVAMLFMADLRTHEHIIPCRCFGFTQGQQSLFLNRFMFERNPFAEPAAERPWGHVVRTEELVPLKALEPTEIYQELMVKAGSHCGAGISLSRVGTMGALALHRESGGRAFSDAEMSLVRELAPHVRRSTQFQMRLGRAEQGVLACHALDQLSAAVFLAGCEANLVFANASARAILRGDGPLIAKKGRLEARQSDDSRRLPRAIFEAATNPCNPGLGCDGTLTMTGTRNAPVRVTVVPLAKRRATGEWPANCCAMVLVEQNSSTNASEILQRRFGLTGAESRLALKIADGSSLSEAAERFHVSINTVGTQLQHIFEKTDTRRQAELLRLLMTIARPLLRG
jgi:DNA-binding CsgD family transcriptional regulator